ncbi:immunoglobulin-like domain-containing protein [Glycomyces albidus]|uniref:Family 43 glycosylhydrolase n=1 Tax=Glycomyces albidus TaxID=2656774 RepID=A0A6L5GAY5_9ACTN|nr:immunoglobulin-like domain-containing protein [Glycomyces albidus]MQM26824.1 family 43 glycosylhydrolase [Glycomyces albidus]
MTSKRLLGTLAAALAVAAPAVPAVAADAAAPLLWYEFDETSGSVVADSSGNGHDGTLTGGTWDEGLRLDGVDDYVDLPDDLLAGLDAITVTAEVYIEPDQASPYFIYGLGNSSGSWGNGYLFTTGNGYRTAISTCHWTCEQNTGSGADLARGTWNHLAYTLADGTAVLYLNGQEVARNEAVTTVPGDIGSGATAANYLGRSLYSGDRYLHGRFADFRIYDGALAAADIGGLAAHLSAEKAAEDAAAIDLGDTGAVTADLDLPDQGANGSQITWASSDPAVIAPDGTVTRPAMEESDAEVTLTATVVLGTVQRQRDFTATVLAEYDDEEAVALDAGAVAIPNLDDVRSSIHLPTEGANGSTITWKSNKPGVIGTDGIVHRDEPGGRTYKVKLTATVERSGEKRKLHFTATVPPLPAEADYTGYFFTYFTGEGTPTGEQVYGALSDGDDPLSFTELNRDADGTARPILTSDQGEQGVRDPFLIRSPEGDRFFLIATDLKINGNGDWNRAQRHGSLSIMVWESDDLVNWSEGRLVQVSPENAGATWAPEAYWDPEQDAYVVFWASPLFATDDHSDGFYHRMMYATTRDFVHFSEAQVWVDQGYSTIDSTMIEDDGTYYRFTKDERSNSASTPCGKFILAETATSLAPDAEWEFLADCIGSGAISAGEGPLVFKSNTEDKWYLFIDEFGGRGYVPFATTDLASGEWTPVAEYDLPASPRHGTVVPITAAEYERLQTAW